MRHAIRYRALLFAAITPCAAVTIEQYCSYDSSFQAQRSRNLFDIELVGDFTGPGGACLAIPGEVYACYSDSPGEGSFTPPGGRCGPGASPAGGPGRAGSTAAGRGSAGAPIVFRGRGVILRLRAVNGPAKGEWIDTWTGAREQQPIPGRPFTNCPGRNLSAKRLACSSFARGDKMGGSSSMAAFRRLTSELPERRSL